MTYHLLTSNIMLTFQPYSVQPWNPMLPALKDNSPATNYNKFPVSVWNVTQCKNYKKFITGKQNLH